MENLDFQNIIGKRFEALKPEIAQAYMELWKKPELPLLEHQSAAYACRWLEQHGFGVATNIGGIPTSFLGTFENGDGPVIGVIAEYDALPGLGNQATPYFAPTEEAGGHGCGHNLIGGSNIGAAIAAAHAMQEMGLKGTVVVIGTPAEEIVYGKIAMLGEGGFNGIDVLLTSHVDYQNGVLCRPCLSLCHGEFHFSGISGHSGAARRHNALEAVELAVQSYERLRAHNFSDAIVEHVIRNGGLMPGITPDRATLWIYVRHPDLDRAVEVYDYVKSVLKSAEAVTDVAITEQFISASNGYLPNRIVADRLFANMKLVGPPKWDDKDMKWMRELVRACKNTESFTLDTQIALHNEGVDPYGQDDGEASWRIPLGRVNWAQPLEVPLHNWATTALSGSDAGFKGPLMASETLARTTVDLLVHPETVSQAKDELAGRTIEKKSRDPMYGPVNEITSGAREFWKAYGL